MHQVRVQIDTADSRPGFKINNNWVAFYSRLWMNQHPVRKGFFKTRTQTALEGSAGEQLDGSPKKGKGGKGKRVHETVPLPPLSPTAQQKLEAWQKKLEADFDYRVRMAAIKQVEELRIPALEDKIKKLTGMLSWPQFSVMWKAEYNKIVKCLHPDHINSRTVEELAEAFDIFTHYKLKFVNDDEDRRNTLRQLHSTMPKSLAEMLAQRAEMLARKRKR